MIEFSVGSFLIFNFLSVYHPLPFYMLFDDSVSGTQ